MSEQQWRVTIAGRAGQPFWSPSRHTARNMAAVVAAGRPFVLEPICPRCGQVIAAGTPLSGHDGRYVHPACASGAVQP